MQLSKNQKVQDFLSDLKSIDPNMFNILMEIREIIFTNHSDTGEKIMYGGIIFFAGADMFSGLFAYKNHVSLEFSKGFLLKDPNNHLEGKGKFRRHIKLFNKEDIIEKEVSYFIEHSV